MSLVTDKVNFTPLLLGFLYCFGGILLCCGQDQFKHNSISRYYSYKRSQSTVCQEPSVEVRERNASAIFTGTIRDLEPDNDHPDTVKATVEVKRILKGGLILNRLAHPLDGSSSSSSRRIVIVEGIGSSEICRSFARKQDTRIFLVNKGLNGELKLNSSLERITLHNIEKTEAAVKNDINGQMTHSVLNNNTTEKPLVKVKHSKDLAAIPDPCKGHVCNFGAKCVTDPTTDGAICRCPESCDTSGPLSAVCGDDGITYNSECHLKIESCITQKNIHIQEYRSCDPCKGHNCSFGAICVTDPASGGATCRCPENCSASGLLSAVCGNDGITYDSECHLHLESCTRQKDIYVQENKPCELKDPCREKQCSFGARCVASLDGLTARCQCPEKCDDFGDSVGSEPVCGTDGHDYTNICSMKKKACEDMKEIEKKFDGKCDPCHGFDCPLGQVCQLDNARRAVCRCGEICQMIFDPVCGSNGKTYANECLMRADACRLQSEVRILFHGECSSGFNPCSEKVCEAGEHCHVDTSVKAHCSCPSECQPLLRPICGSDGRTYDSECHLKQYACLNKEDVTVSYQGSCEKPGLCSKHKCLNGGHCVILNNHPVCTCPSCSEEYEPVCGSDNQSYPNECKLQHESCKLKKVITVRYRGRCLADICAQKKCDFFSVCEIDDKGSSQCVCPDTCEQVTATVCGSDGIMYNNECELQSASCKQQKVITVISNGSCDPCDGVSCEFGSKCLLGKCICIDYCPTDEDPVCANNGVTYPNECTMIKVACIQRITLEIMNIGSCDEMSGSGDFAMACDETNCQFEGSCEPDKNGTVRCICSFNCDALRSPVCGSDGKTYGNECQMKEESCQKQVSIKVQPMENCEDIDEELCDGKPPLVNPLTGLEYNCNRGKDICPAGSYCHRLGATARCCREDQLIPNCLDSQYGCCPDGVTAAPGPNNAGCPNVCQCNLLGSLSKTCDPVTRQCTCRSGVGGVRCDRCNPNYWGLPKIAEGNNGCLPCGCNIHGSMRDDCEQMTGRCMCRPGITGQKCSICSNGKYLSPMGCSDVMLNDDIPPPPSCSDKECHFGSICQMSNGLPECVCLLSCSAEDSELQAGPVCGSDGQTHRSFCQMTLSACRLQKNITVARLGNCYGALDDFCESDSDCLVANSYCDNGLCTCLYSWKPKPDKKSCTAARVMVASFSGQSYLQLKRFNYGSREMTIEINFQPQRQDGILFYAAQSQSGTSDFISLALKDGFIEFRYNLGSGPAFIKSTGKVKLTTFHRVTASRVGKNGALSLDNGTEASGSSLGSLRSLNLNTPIYLGYVPDLAESLMTNLGITAGFVGCIESLVISSSELSIIYDLSGEHSPDIEKRLNIGSCGASLCSSFPCLNGGMCLEADDGSNFQCSCLDRFSGIFCEVKIVDSPCTSFPCGFGGICHPGGRGGFTCICLPGYEGDRCTKENRQAVSEAEVPDDATRAIAFNGLTIFQYQNAISAVERSQATNKFEIRFRSKSANGLILLMHKANTIEADYLAIAINGGYVQVSFNLGKELPTDLVFLTSPLNVTDNMWHTLVFVRIKRRAQLYVDHEHSLVTTVTAPGATHLDTDGHLWIGGSRSKVHGLTEAYQSGYVGCIQYVKVNDHVLNLVKDRDVNSAISFCDA